jgi:hypothetical protein
MRNKVSLPIGKDDNPLEMRYIQDKNTDRACRRQQRESRSERIPRGLLRG